MQDWRAVVGHNVQRLRRARGVNQEQLAHDAQVDVTYLRGIERARRNPSLLLMARVAEALGVALPALLDLESAEEPAEADRPAR